MSHNLDGYGWDWRGFIGSDECLASNHRDLAKLDLVIDLVPDTNYAVQAGGNIGIFPKFLSETFQTVYTFEPDPDHFLVMCKNAPELNIIKFQTALSDTLKFVSMQHGSPTHTHEGVTHVGGDGAIPAIPLDRLDLPGCDLLYLDIEGWEMYALFGSISTIMRCLPIVVLEMNICLERAGGNTKEIHDLMTGLGYIHVARLYTDMIFIHRKVYSPSMYNKISDKLAKIDGATWLKQEP